MFQLNSDLLVSTQACASLEANYQPKVTFVVVQKRHHTRLFAHNHNDRNSMDRSGNILPGKSYKQPAPHIATIFSTMYYDPDD